MKDRLRPDDEVHRVREILGKYTSLMDHEYHLDQSTYLNDFDRSWRPKSYSVVFRNQLRSIDRSHFATRSTFSIDSPMQGKHDVIIKLVIQDDHQAQRMLADIGYGYQIADNQRLGVSMTVEQYKPDLDWTFFYEYENETWGLLDARIVFFDFANNLIFDAIGVDPVLDRFERSYSSSPKLGALKWNKFWTNWKIGLLGGIQNRSRASIAETPRNEGDEAIYFSKLWFVGSEIAYRSFLGELRLFAILHDERQSVRNETHRGDIVYSNLAFENFSTGMKYWKRQDKWSLSTDFIYDNYENNSHNSEDPNSSRRGFRQQEIILQSELRRHFWSNKLVIGLGHAFQWRNLKDVSRINLAYAPNLFNSRTTLTSGIHFRKDALIEIGVSFDLDGDQFYTDRGPTRFDGAFGRVVYTMK